MDEYGESANEDWFEGRLWNALPRCEGPDGEATEEEAVERRLSRSRAEAVFLACSKRAFRLRCSICSLATRLQRESFSFQKHDPQLSGPAQGLQ